MRALALSVLLLAPAAAAQSSSDLVAWTVRAVGAERGETARVELGAEVAEGWRLYGVGSPVGVPLVLTLADLPRGVSLGPLTEVGVVEGYDEVFEARYPYYEGSGRLVQRLAVGRRAARGRHEVTGRVRYAVCNDRICLPPVTTSFRATLVVR